MLLTRPPKKYTMTQAQATSNSPTGYLLIDKPQGITSHDVVYQVRRVTGVKKVGHAGTLDPLATGLLIVLVGKAATKQSNQLIGLDKCYEINMDLGYATDSLDTDGQITEKLSLNDNLLQTLDSEKIVTTISGFEKTYSQTVPLFSAVKVDGRKMYKLGYKARHENKQQKVTLPKRTVTIYSITDIKVNRTEDSYPHVSFIAHVSSGTYTRSLVRDIGKALNIPATQTALRRLSIGPFSVNKSIRLNEVTKNDIIPVERLSEYLEN